MHWEENIFAESNSHSKGHLRVQTEKEDCFMHSKPKQNKTSMYSLCLANNYSTGPEPGGHEYNLLPRGYRLSKQQERNFCINSLVVWCMHDSFCVQNHCLESIPLPLVPSPVSSSPCPAFLTDLITVQRYLWLNKD